jgi:hypothetical protein
LPLDSLHVISVLCSLYLLYYPTVAAAKPVKLKRGQDKKGGKRKKVGIV